MLLAPVGQGRLHVSVWRAQVHDSRGASPAQALRRQQSAGQASRAFGVAEASLHRCDCNGRPDRCLQASSAG